MIPKLQDNPFFHKHQLVHGSHIDNLESLLPLSKKIISDEIDYWLYASSCPYFAFGHTLRHKINEPEFFLYGYKILGKKFIYCSAPQHAYTNVISTPVTLYICDRQYFSKAKRIKGLLERLSLGLLKNTNTEWICPHEIRHTFKTELFLSDLCNHIYLHNKGASKLAILFNSKKINITGT